MTAMFFGAEVRELAVFSIRFMAVGLVLDIPSLLFSYYLQGINERILVNVINVAELFVPVLTAFVMGMNFGGSDEDNVYTSITSEFDVIVESRLAERFCIEHGIGARESKLAALFISPENLSGMKIVMTLADEVRYFNAFNSNNIMIYIDTAKGESPS